MNNKGKIEEIAHIYSGLQKEICQTLEQADGLAVFEENNWEKDMGSGKTCVIRKGAAIEKGGVNYSFVRGAFTQQMENLLGEKASHYSATGISSIMHPVNPHVPIIHTNVRYFALDNGTEWFGGGIDLSPHYIDISEARSFHQVLKRICDKYSFDLILFTTVVRNLVSNQMVIQKRYWSVYLPLLPGYITMK